MFSNWPGYTIAQDYINGQPVYAPPYAPVGGRPVVVPPMGSPVLRFRGVSGFPRFAYQPSTVPRPLPYAAAPELASAVSWLRDFVEGERRVLHDRIRLLESTTIAGGAGHGATGGSSSSSAVNLRRELDAVRRDFATSLAMEEEHREKMDGYVKALMAEVERQQQELFILTEKYSNVVRELEISRQRLKELEKDKEREIQYNAIHANKLNSKDAEIATLNCLVDRLQREKAKLDNYAQRELGKQDDEKEEGEDNSESFDLGLMFKVNRLEAIVREQNAKLIAAERAKPNAVNELSTEDVFACLRSQHTPQKTKEQVSSIQNTGKDGKEQWLEPLELDETAYLFHSSSGN